MPRQGPSPGFHAATEHLRREGAPHRLPERLRREAEEVHGGSAALYVMDVDGSSLRMLAGDPDRVPASIHAPIGIGPEVPPESLPALAGIVGGAIPGCGSAPLVLADRALGVLVRLEGDAPGLDVSAREAALALETISGYTDAVHAARRHKYPQPAAEMQQNLLPPRIARVSGADLAGGVLPGYDVGGDFFDYAENGDGVWLAIADAVGKDNEAAALSAVTIGALRASRRSGRDLEETVDAMRHAVTGAGRGRPAFVTAVVALWHPATHRLRWITAGHPRPIVARADGALETLETGVRRPLGISGGDARAPAGDARLGPGDLLLLFSDGLVEQPHWRTSEPLGLEAVHDVVRATAAEGCARTVRRLQDMVIGAADGPLRDDASLLAMGVDRPGT